jgi:hypothetical protein
MGVCVRVCVRGGGGGVQGRMQARSRTIDDVRNRPQMKIVWFDWNHDTPPKHSRVLYMTEAMLTSIALVNELISGGDPLLDTRGEHGAL